MSEQNTSPDLAADTTRRQMPGGWILVSLLLGAIATALAFCNSTMGWICAGGIALAVALLAGLGLLGHLRRNAPDVLIRRAKDPRAYLEKGNKIRAEQCYQEMMVKASAFEASDYRRALILCELASYLDASEKPKEAAAMARECVPILDAAKSAEPHWCGYGLNQCAVFEIRARRFDKAQEILEKSFDCAILAKHPASNRKSTSSDEVTLHLNLAYLFIQMNAIPEADHQLNEAECRLKELPYGFRRKAEDVLYQLLAERELIFSNMESAADHLEKVQNKDTMTYQRVRAKLHFACKEYSEAAELLAQLLYVQSKHFASRPILLDSFLIYAEANFALGRQEYAFGGLKAMLAIMFINGIPRDAKWREVVETWLPRARELGQTEVLGRLETEARRMVDQPYQNVTVIERFRVQPEPRGIDLHH
jgi:tetratricopeptide (TPR) repeat protein